ncbi:MAG: enoyl-CoA hydratase/isomerase family protein [Rhodospirillales bacterium]|nr:enoyl-CoA hydratase/isomerase family protein [Rhodospirillales bacterium]
MNDTVIDNSTDILFGREGRVGHVTMNRPKALNALTHDMSVRFDRQLAEWALGRAVETVVITGAGDRAFSAGGDVRALWDSIARRRRGEADDGLTRNFYWDEYRLNRRIFRFPKPYVALVDGIAMGGGVGVSFTGRWRVVGDKTLFAMPETGIGLFPDVGGTYFLSRCPGQLGVYLGLTGARIKAADLIHAGLATHYVPSAHFAALFEALKAEPAEQALKHFAVDAGAAPIADVRASIDRCFAGDTIEGILAALEREGGEWAQQTLATLAQKAPLSLRVTLRQLRAGAKLDFEDCMRMEFRLVRRFMADHDFFEGIRAVIVDKDNRPRWNPASLAEATAAKTDAYFVPLDDGELSFED